jgi:hypothetical protein
LDELFEMGTIKWSKYTSMVDNTGDADLWLNICNLNNRPVVHVPVITFNGGAAVTRIDGQQSLYWGDLVVNGVASYPATAPVMDQHGHLHTGLTPDNLFPMCVRIPTDPQAAAQLDAYLKSHPVGGAAGAVMPYCPSSLFQPGGLLVTTTNSDTGAIEYPDAKKWAARGAINAGAAVFLYLDQLERGQITPTPLFSQCEQLKTTAP